jgi:hypothetical protein
MALIILSMLPVTQPSQSDASSRPQSSPSLPCLGLILPPHRWRSLVPPLSSALQSDDLPIEICPIDVSEPISLQGPFDVILSCVSWLLLDHESKIVDDDEDVSNQDSKDPKAPSIASLRAVEEFEVVLSNSVGDGKIPIVDTVASQRPLIDHRLVHAAFSTIDFANFSSSTGWALDVPPLFNLDSSPVNDLPFPLAVRPAVSTPTSR